MGKQVISAATQLYCQGRCMLGRDSHGGRPWRSDMSSELSGPAQPFLERVGGKVVEALTTPLLSLLPYCNTAGAPTAM